MRAPAARLVCVSGGTEIPEFEPAAAAELLAGEAVAVDVREPVEWEAGHIAGALNAPFTDNLTAEAPGVFRSAADLRRHYEFLGLTPETEVACSCGSGVTACHDILALALAGFPMPRLYPGSWSEWCLDASMPTATGEPP